MKEKSKSLLSGGFLKNITTLLSGKAGAALATLLMTPIVARIFDPSAFGVAALFLSIATILSPLATLCYEFASVLPESEKKGRQLTVIAAKLAIAFALLMLIVVALKRLLLPGEEYLTALGVYEWLLPVMVSLVALASVAENWHVRIKGFKNIAQADIYSAITIPGSRIGIGALFGGSIGALIAGLFIGVTTKIFVLWRSAKDSFKDIKGDFAPGEAALVMKHYRDFPVFNTPTRSIRKFSNDMPIILLGFLFTPAVVGLYSMSHRLIMLPVNSVAFSIRKVFLEKISRAVNDDGDIGTILIKMIGLLLVIGLIPFSVLWFAGADIIAIVLGDKWLGAGVYVEILTPWVYSLWVSAPCTAVFMVLRKQKYFMVIQFSQTFVRASVFAYAYFMSLTIESTLIAFTAVSLAANILVASIAVWFAFRSRSLATGEA